MTTNLGSTPLRKKKRAADPMQTYDRLPPQLRHWIANAQMPWSPASCQKIWTRARTRGEPIERVLARLSKAEAATLARAATAKRPASG
ncbi:DUF6525 family protein [Lentibacter sp.]|uniref:DUF6525 family protein n=1 Tax=Lentibacter sp. TaxID=2024994 RepID=UPI003F6D83B3